MEITPPKTALRLPAIVLSTLVLCGLFGWWQNRYGTTGGDISTAKMLWLFLALTLFFVLPAWLWKDETLHPRSRKFWGWWFFSWVVRGCIEMPMLLLSHLWKCEYGIGHTLLMLVILITVGTFKLMGDKISFSAIPLLGVALISEAVNALLFSKAGHPEVGQYFASDDAAFDFINKVTAIEVGLLGAWLGAWMWRYVFFNLK